MNIEEMTLIDQIAEYMHKQSADIQNAKAHIAVINKLIERERKAILAELKDIKKEHWMPNCNKDNCCMGDAMSIAIDMIKEYCL